MSIKYVVDEDTINNIKETQKRILKLLTTKVEIPKKTTNFELLTVSQSAKRLNVSEVFLRKKIEKRELAIKRIGSAIRIEESELNKLVK